ncbi:hypothetical protein ENTCAN_07686 [Enterobacter cancerogenus ATCC 35316]|nr:hypothetical protein ENTCAN_07686 [Enterobacter cancerogenus ATCC 35316]
MFIFAKRAAPFRGKNLSLHRFGARDAQCWCGQVHVKPDCVCVEK